uniref:Uncharacterized protein n=1 Tax=Anguilla anguilla TaxID=7936 RepID=A0A0E9QEL5_ANGAN
MRTRSIQRKERFTDGWGKEGRKEGRGEGETSGKEGGG